DDELDVGGKAAEIALRLEDRVNLAATLDLVDESAQRGDKAVVVEGRRAQGPRERQELLHRLVRERLRLGELVAELDRRPGADRLEAKQDGGQGLVHLVMQVAGDASALLLLGAQGDARRAP